MTLMSVLGGSLGTILQGREPTLWEQGRFADYSCGRCC